MERLFRTHFINAKGKLAVGAVTEAFDELHTKLKFPCASSPREWAECQRALEVACFYAKKALASQEKYRAKEGI